MADEQYGFPLPLDHILHAVEALSLKGQIADRKHFVHDQDRRVHAGCDAKPKADLHARAVSFDRSVYKFFKFSEGDDLIELLLYLGPTHSQNRRVEVDILAAREVWDQPRPHFDQRRHGPPYVYA